MQLHDVTRIQCLCVCHWVFVFILLLYHLLHLPLLYFLLVYVCVLAGVPNVRTSGLQPIVGCLI